MKSIKIFLLLLVSITLTNCSDNNEAPAYPLTYENISGTYNIQSLSIDTETTTLVGIIPVTAKANGVGDTFQVDMILNTDKTYSIKGEHRIVITTSVPGVAPTTTQEIVVIDESGNYTINADNSITFSDQNADFLSGDLNVTVFTANNFSLTQEIEGTEPLTNSDFKVNLAVSFIRK